MENSSTNLLDTVVFALIRNVLARNGYSTSYSTDHVSPCDSYPDIRFYEVITSSYRAKFHVDGALVSGIVSV
jgi:hypothetical protein